MLLQHLHPSPAVSLTSNVPTEVLARISQNAGWVNLEKNLTPATPTSRRRSANERSLK